MSLRRRLFFLATVAAAIAESNDLYVDSRHGNRTYFCRDRYGYIADCRGNGYSGADDFSYGYPDSSVDGMKVGNGHFNLIQYQHAELVCDFMRDGQVKDDVSNIVWRKVNSDYGYNGRSDYNNRGTYYRDNYGRRDNYDRGDYYGRNNYHGRATDYGRRGYYDRGGYYSRIDDYGLGSFARSRRGTEKKRTTRAVDDERTFDRDYHQRYFNDDYKGGNRNDYRYGSQDGYQYDRNSYPNYYGYSYQNSYRSPYPDTYRTSYRTSYRSKYPDDYGSRYPDNYGYSYQSGYGSRYPDNYGYGYQSDYGSRYPDNGYQSDYRGRYQSDYSPYYSGNYRGRYGNDYRGSSESDYRGRYQNDYSPYYSSDDYRGRYDNNYYRPNSATDYGSWSRNRDTWYYQSDDYRPSWSRESTRGYDDWYSSDRFQSSTRVYSQGSRSILYIRDFRPSDYGRYRCMATRKGPYSPYRQETIYIDVDFYDRVPQGAGRSYRRGYWQ